MPLLLLILQHKTVFSQLFFVRKHFLKDVQLLKVISVNKNIIFEEKVICNIYLYIVVINTYLEVKLLLF